MAMLPILRYPHPNLANVAQEVAAVDDAIRTLVANMIETMYAANGIGLAATQVDHHLRVVVIDVSEERNQALVLINPRITTFGEDRQKGKEGCLSVPEIYDNVERAQSLTVEALDLEGKHFSLDAEDLLAICIQHEIDHLNGYVFVQHLSRFKQDRIRSKLKKLALQDAAD